MKKISITMLMIVSMVSSQICPMLRRTPNVMSKEIQRFGKVAASATHDAMGRPLVNLTTGQQRAAERAHVDAIAKKLAHSKPGRRKAVQDSLPGDLFKDLDLAHKGKLTFSNLSPVEQAMQDVQRDKAAIARQARDNKQMQDTRVAAMNQRLSENLVMDLINQSELEETYNHAFEEALQDMRTQGFIEPHTIQFISSLRNSINPEDYENFIREVEQLRQQHETDLARFEGEGGAQQRFAQPKADKDSKFGTGARVGAFVGGLGLGYVGQTLFDSYKEQQLKVELAEKYGVAPEHIIIHGFDDESGKPIVSISIEASPNKEQQEIISTPEVIPTFEELLA